MAASESDAPSPHVPPDPSATLELQVTTARLAVLGALAMGTVLLAASALQGEASQAVAPIVSRAVTGLLLLLLAGLGKLLCRHGRPQAASVLVLFGAALAIGAHAWNSGLALEAAVLPALAVLVTLSGVLLHARWGWAMAGLCALMVAGLWWGEEAGLTGIVSARRHTEIVASLALSIVLGLLGSAMIRGMLLKSLELARIPTRRLNQLLALGADWSFTCDAQARVSWISPSFETRSGRRIDEMMRLGQPGGPQIVEDTHHLRLQTLERDRMAYRDIPLTVRFPDGAELVMALSGDPIDGGVQGFQGWQGVARNVTAEVQALRQVERRQSLVDGLFRITPDALAVIDLHSDRLLLTNAGFAAASGFEASQLEGRTIADLGLALNPMVIEALRQRVLAGEVLHGQPITIRRSDGELREALLSAAQFDWSGRPVAVIGLRDVTAQRRAASELVRAKAEAESANRAKSSFLATMSHEIRTPLSAVLGLARLLAAVPPGDPQQASYVGPLADAADMLDQIVSDVLDLSKIEAGRITLEKIDFDLHQLVRKVAHTYETIARERGLSFVCTLGPELPRQVNGDPTRLRQILTNYLTNALKFTSQGQLGIEVRRCAAGVRLAVTDTGIGVPPDRLGSLFHPFVQAEATTTRHYGGTGLGLSICQELATLMGGRVGVTSEYGQGSSFWVELPLHDDAHRQADAGSAGIESDQLTRLTGLRVLIAEDDEVNMLIATATLQMLGVETFQAADGQQALTLALAAKPPLDAVLLDLHMPRMNGLELARALRADPRTAALRLIGLTASDLDEDRCAALDAGMDACTCKPASPAELRRLLTKPTSAALDAETSH